MSRVVIFALALAACQPLPTPRPPPPDADSAVPSPDPLSLDAARRPPHTDGTPCDVACSVLSWIGCPEGNPTPKGESCAAVCTDVQRFPGLALPTACIAKARSIDAARACGVKCVTK